MECDADLDHLVDKARRGDQHAWEQLLASLYPRLRAFVARRVPPPDVEDVVSEAMTRAVAGVDRFRPGPAGFDGWVFGIARNLVADHFRATAREKRYVMAGNVTMPETMDLPGELLDLDEKHASLRRCFALLSDGERELLELRVIAGLGAEQVAAMLSKRPGAVRSAQSRALSRLRNLMEQDDAEG